jgi:hypothetical protein
MHYVSHVKNSVLYVLVLAQNVRENNKKHDSY